MDSILNTPRGFTGMVSLQLVDLIQMVCLSRSDLVIRVRSSEGSGIIYVQQGRIHHAQTSSLQGEQAFFEIFTWADGRFEILPFEESGLSSVDKTWEYLILEAVRRRDEKLLNSAQKHKGSEPAEEGLETGPDDVLDGSAAPIPRPPEPPAGQVSKREAPVRVLIVDDATLMRKALHQILSGYESIEIVGMAANGRECLELIPRLCPDVITLDLDMPVMNGITTIKNIMIQHQIPIVVVSSLIQDGYFAFEVLRLGVMDFVPKPSRIAGHNRAEEEELIRMRVLAASGMEVNRMRRLKRVSRGDGFRGNAERLPRVLAAIGTTLAGPNTVMRIITQLSPGFPGSIIALQELHPKILEPFCSHLNRISPLEVIPVTRPCALEPGKVYMCSTSLGVQLSRSPHEPEAIMVDTADSSTSPIDQLFESVARCFHQSSCGVLLTGVGEDGARGLGIIKEKGGLTIVQKQECCIYPNLVDHALKEGVVDLIIPDCQMADQLHILAGVDSGPCR